jgi:3-hydroxyacyl-CoA dehydrogenase
MSCAEVGIVVRIVDVSAKGLARGLALIKSNFERSRRLTPAQKQLFISRITGSVDMAAVADCDLVVEAVFEVCAHLC